MISSLDPNYSKTPFIRKKMNELTRKPEFNSDPEVSIITAFYNTGNVFWETFYSVINQTFRDFEWLIVDDGSTKEDALKILSEVEKLDNRIRIIYNPENLGLGLTRNNGAKNAKGNLLFFIDSDDMVEFTFLEKCVLCLKFNLNYSFVSAYTIGFDAKKYLWKYGFIHPMNFFEANYAVNCFVCRRSLFALFEYSSDKGGMEDWDFWLNAASRGFWGYTIPEFLYWYRERKNRNEEWPNIFDGNKSKAFIDNLAKKYKGKISNQSFDLGFSRFPTDFTFEGQLKDICLSENRILFLIDYCLEENQNKLIKDYIAMFHGPAVKITIVINDLRGSEYSGDFTEITDDVFVLNHLSTKVMHHHILQRLVSVRGIQRIISININSNLFFSAYLKSLFAQIQFDVIVLNIKPLMQIEQLVSSYGLDSELIDFIGTSTNDIKFFLESNNGIYGKVFFMPPLIQEEPNPTSKSFIKIKKERLGLHPSVFMINYTGNIAFSSQFYSLHLVIDKLNKAGYSNYLFVFFGWGDAFQDFKNYLFDKGIQDKVWLFSANANDELLEENIAVSDAYLDLSGSNGFTDYIRSAIIKGIPVLSAGNSFMKDIIDKSIGYITEEKINKDEISDFIAINISKLIDSPQLGSKMRKNCIDKAKAVFQKNNCAALKFVTLRNRGGSDSFQNKKIDVLTRKILSIKN